MEDKKTLYIIEWSQPYTEYQIFQEAIAEMRLEDSEMREAKEVIKHIMDIK